VCHVVSGDLWAGAEAQIAALLSALSRNPQFRLSAILLNEGRLAAELRKCGVEVKVIPESENSFAGIAKEGIEFLRARPLEILHSHRHKENLLAALLAWRCHIPVVIRTQHGAPEPFGGLKAVKQTAVQALDRLVARYATDSIISVSADLEHSLTRYVRAGKIALIANGLDTTAVNSRLTVPEAKTRLGIPAESPVVGYAGRLAPIKRLDIFVAAAQEIRNRFPEARFVIAGDGSEEPALRRAARAAGIEDRFLFLGYRDDVYDVLRAFDVFVLSSDHEGLPIVLLEALCLQVPVVARRVGGIPEVVQHGLSGLLVDSPDPRALAEACIKLCGDENLRMRLAGDGAQRVAEHFSSERAARLTSELYLTLVTKTTDQKPLLSRPQS
jgi:glycosyltransferase involved in cell wall biosynthesis